MISSLIRTTSGGARSTTTPRAFNSGSKIAIYGDSITDDCTTNGATGDPLRTRSVGYMGWLNFISGQVFDFVNPTTYGSPYINGTFGVSGERIDQILARIQDVIDYAPDICVVLGGSNDLVVTSRTVAQITADLNTVYTTLTAAGILVVAVPTIVRSSWSSLTAPQITAAKLRQQAINNYIRDYPRVKKNKLVLVCDPTARHIDATSAVGDPLTGILRDGAHFTPNGAYLMGKTLWDTLSPHYSVPPNRTYAQNDTYDATENPRGNLVVNSGLTGTGGTKGTGVTGGVASNFTVDRGSGTHLTAVCSKGTVDLDGNSGITQIIAITADGSGTTNEYIRFKSSANFTTGVAVNDIIESGCNVRITGITGKYLGAAWAPTFTDSVSGSRRADDLSVDIGDPYLATLEDHAGVFKSIPVKITGTFSAGNIELRVYMTANVVGTVTLEIEHPWVRTRNT